MTLRNTFPGPALTARFRNDVEGWTVRGLDATSASTSPTWAAVDDAAAALDITGACRYAPPADAGLWFFAAPAAIIEATRSLAGGLIAFVTDAAPPAPGSGVTEAPDVVLQSPERSAGLRLPAPATPGLAVGHAGLDARASWVDLATGQPLAAGDLETLLTALTGLLIRGGPTVANGQTSLFAVELYADPAEALDVTADAWFEDGVLTVQLSASPYATAYAIEVLDATGAVVLRRQATAAEAQAGPIALNDPQFTPTDGATYSLRVQLAGPADTTDVAFATLAAPVITVSLIGAGARLDWPPVEHATAYGLRVAPSAGGAPLVDRSGISAGPVDLGPTDGLAPGVDYEVKARSLAGASKGPWSAATALRLPTAQELLQALRDRIVAQRSAGAVIFDAAVLPDAAAGDPGAIRQTLTAGLGADLTLALADAAEPVLTDASLTLDGAADVLGATAMPAQAVFTVRDGLLALQLVLTPDAAWRLSDGFALIGTPWDDLPFEQLKIRFASRDDAEGGPLRAGFNLAADLLVSPQLARLTRGVDAPADVLRAAVSGSLQDADGETLLTLTAAAPLADVTASVTDIGAWTITGGLLALSRTAGAAGTPPVDRLQIVGTADGVACAVDLPTLYGSTLGLTFDIASPATQSVSSLLTIAGVGDITAVPAFVKTTFGALAVGSVGELSLRFDPSGGEPTEIVLRTGLAEPWTFAGSVVLDQAQLLVRTLHFPAHISPGFNPSAVVLSGVVTAQGVSVAAELVAREVEDWTLSLAADPPVTLPVLASLAGFDGEAAFAGLPSPLRPVASVGLSDIVITGRPDTGLTGVDVVFTQTEDWSLGDVIALKNATLAVHIDLAPLSAWGMFGGTVQLGSGDSAVSFRASGPVPPAEGQAWTVRLEDGQQITLPNLTDLKALFGGAEHHAPSGVDEVSNLVVDGLLVRFDPAATPILREVAFSVVQAGDWVVIGPDSLVLSNVYGRFDLSNAGQSLTLDVGGAVTVLGAEIRGRFYRDTPDSDWVLNAQAASPVAAAGGVASFDSWMSPTGIAGYLGAANPFTGPAAIGAVQLNFAADDGALKALRFAFSLDLGWTLIPGKLEIVSLGASLATAMPVSSDSWTGSLYGSLTVFGATVALSASKPSTTSPWSFRGSLVQAASIDLAASAGSLQDGRDYLLPEGIAAIGAFPSQITLTTAEVEATPDSGYFRFAGAATFTNWTVGYGAASLEIKHIGGEILVKSAGDPARARVVGGLALGGVDIDVFVQLGSSAAVDTIIAGAVSSDQLTSASLSSIVDGVAGDGTWAGAPVPAGFSPPGLSSAGFYLNLTQDVMALYGAATFGTSAAQAALLVKKLPPATADAPAAYGYAFVLNVQDFRFANIASALSVLDDVVTLDSVSLAVSSFDVTDGDPVAPLADLATQAAEVETPAGASPAVPTKPQASRIGRGLNVYGSVSFQGPLWSAVKYVLDLGDATLVLQARIDPDAPGQTLFVADLTDATLLSYLHFSRLSVRYQPSPPPPPAPSGSESSGGSQTPAPPPAPYLSLGGDGSLQLPGVPAINFTGQVAFTTEGAGASQSVKSASLDAAVTASETELFGIPNVSLTLSSIKMGWTTQGAQSEWRRTSLSVTATATLASLTLNAMLDLSDATRQRIVLTLGAAGDAASSVLSLKTLLVDGLGASWLDGLVPDLSFSDGSLEWIKPQSGDPTYALHAKASIIGLGFLFDATLTKSVGITGSAALANPIDFGFLKLSGPAKVAGPKASLTATDASKILSLESVVTLLDHDIGLTLSYAKPASGDPVYTGTATTEISFGDLGSVSPTVIGTYSESGGLDVKLDGLSLPWDQIKQFMRFVELIEQAASGLPKDPCQVLGALGLGPDAVQCSFDCSLAFPHLTPASGDTPTSVDIGLKITYKIKLNVAGYTGVIREASLDLDFLSLEIPSGGLTFSSVAGSLLTALVNAGPNIVKALFSDPEAMKTFAEMLIARQVASSIISNLICRQTEVGAADAEASLAAGEAAVAAEAWAEAMVAFAAGFVIAGAVISFLESIWDSITGEDKKKKERAEQQRARAVQAIANLAKPLSASLAAASADSMTMGCVPPPSIVEGDGCTYRFDLFEIPAGGGAPIAIPPRNGQSNRVDWNHGDDAPSLTVAYDLLRAGANYQVVVTALMQLDGLMFQGSAVHMRPQPQFSGGLDMSVPGQADGVASAVVHMPDSAIAQVTIEQIGASVSATVIEGNETAGQIVLQWVDAQGGVIAPDPAAPALAGGGAHGRHQLRLAPPSPTGQAILQATAVVGGVRYTTRSNTLTVLDLAAPTVTGARFVGDTFDIAANWGAVQGAGGYRLQLLDDATASAPISSVEAGTALNAKTSAGGQAGRTVHARVATLPPAGDGAVWSETIDVKIPGALMSFSLASPAEGQSAAGLSFQISQVLPGDQVSFTLAPGDADKPLGAVPVAAFAAERSESLTGSAAIVRRLSYSVQDISPPILIAAPLDYQWPAPTPLILSADWALALPGAPALWSKTTPPLRMALSLVDGLGDNAARLALAAALDRAEPAAGQTAALFALVHDAEGLATSLAATASSMAEAAAAARQGLAAAGQPIDTVTLAAILKAAFPAATLADLAGALKAAAPDGDSMATLLTAFRAAGLGLNDAAVQLRALNPNIGATEMAAALVAAYQDPAMATSYAETLAQAGVPASAAARRVLRVANLGGETSLDDGSGLTLPLVLLRARGATVSAAAQQVKARRPAITATVLAAALVNAWNTPATGVRAAVPALCAAFGPSRATREQLALALAAVGVAPTQLSELADIAFGLDPDAGERASALLAIFAPQGSVEALASLSQAAGSPVAAARAALPAFEGLSASARMVVLIRAYDPLASQPVLLAAAASAGGAVRADVEAALLVLVSGVDAAAAADAWTRGQDLIATLA
ncbi:hypothetical protein AS593_04225 [Caulobacter vibrioides]|nr:hypothetical protein AS593_04225 [Caulobacter vibrioides]